MKSMKLLAITLALAGCNRAEYETTNSSKPGVAFAEPPPTTTAPPAPVTANVELTAVTLADDCGNSAPAPAPPAIKAKAKSAKADMKADMARESMQRRCEQTSMQLSISASAVAKIQIKSVELFDEAGASLGTLTPSNPTRWSDATGMYDAWDESLAANSQVNVSYTLQQPNWSKIGDRWNRTYTLKTVVSIGGVDQAAKKDVTLTAPTTLPPNVKT